MIRRPFIVCVASLTGVALVALTGCATPAAPVPVTETAARTSQLSMFARLVNESGLADALRGAGPYTVFAPSDDAFKAVPAKTMAELSGNREMLRAVLSYHVLPVRVVSGEVKNGDAKTMQGANVSLSKAGSFMTIEDAVVQQADIAASNGVVHVIDRVLMPPKR